ncbi:MAG TPA: hypothetical protein PLD34_00395 [Pseudothermotoga sp.]|nr:hypothetical protein [Pseudothermotoga sp.]
MGTREDKGDIGTEGSISSSSHRAITWFVLLLSGVLIAANLRTFNLHGQELYIYEQAGVIYYVGFNEPGVDDLEIVSQWLRLPVINLLYDGPSEYGNFLKRKLDELGVLVGIGDVLRVEIKTSRDMCHYEISYGEFSKSATIEVSRLTDNLANVLSEIFQNLEKPQTGFLVEVGEQINIKKTSTDRPVEFRYVERLHSVSVKGKKMLLSEGFYDFFGKTVYVDTDMQIEEPVFFVEDATKVYKDRDDLLVYKAGKLFFPDGRFIVVSEPFGVINGKILEKLITVKIDNSLISAPIIGRYEQFLLLANGVVAPLDLSWAMKICGPIIEWAVNKERLYVLDVFSYLRAIDLKNRKTLWEKRFPGAWGIGSYDDLIYVGMSGKVFALNESGEIVSSQDCCDFGIWKEGIITLKSPQEGIVIRSQIGFAILNGGKAVVYIDEPRCFENVIDIEFSDWGAVVVTHTGCWVVEK